MAKRYLWVVETLRAGQWEPIDLIHVNLTRHGARLQAARRRKDGWTNIRVRPWVRYSAEDK